jgi:nucleoid-associated protein YgaU
VYISPTSPYNLAEIVQDSEQRLAFALRNRLLWEDLAGVRAHVVREGDTLWNLALRYYGSSGGQPGDGARLWWVIADFQSEPINDPTVQLTPGEIILIPPLPAIQTVIAGPGAEFLTSEE